MDDELQYAYEIGKALYLSEYYSVLAMLVKAVDKADVLIMQLFNSDSLFGHLALHEIRT